MTIPPSVFLANTSRFYSPSSEQLHPFRKNSSYFQSLILLQSKSTIVTPLPLTISGLEMGMTDNDGQEDAQGHMRNISLPIKTEMGCRCWVYHPNPPSGHRCSFLSLPGGPYPKLCPLHGVSLYQWLSMQRSGLSSSLGKLHDPAHSGVPYATC